MGADRKRRSEPTAIEAPYWKWGRNREEALEFDGVMHEWETFKAWVESLPDGFSQLKQFAQTGRANDRRQLGLDLIEAWKKHPGKETTLSGCVESLADGISLRIIRWLRACKFVQKPDPASLVLFED